MNYLAEYQVSFKRNNLHLRNNPCREHHTYKFEALNDNAAREEAVKYALELCKKPRTKEMIRVKLEHILEIE